MPSKQPVQRPKWVVVTGASGGIGRATVRALADDGWSVVVHFGKSKAAAEETAAYVQSSGHGGIVLGADMSDVESALSIADQAWEMTGGFDAWIHAAGADVLTGAEAKLSYADKLDLLVRVDLVGTVLASRRAGQLMRDRGDGVIVTIGWDQSATGMEGDSGELFAAVKGGIAAFSRSLAKSLAPQVRVHCVAPGWIRTEWGENASEPWQERVIRETPLRRWGAPDDVAQTIAFLVSPKARFLTGQTINVNGGVVTS